MNRYLSITVAGLIGILLVSGCSPSSASMKNSVAPNSTPQTESSITPVTSSPSWKSVGGNSFLIQGKIVEINNRAPYSLKIHLEQVIVPGPLTSPQPKFPEQVGAVVTVRFEHPFPSKGLMQPKNGEEVILGVKQYTAGTDTTPFWGSDASQYYYNKNGNFYGENGLQLGIAT